MKGTLRLVTESFRSHPAMDTAVSRAILMGVSDGHEPDTLRVYRPGAVVSFGPKDTRAPGYDDAVRAARASGFEAVRRLSGGTAAVFHEQTIAFAWTVADPAPREGVQQRFEELAGIMEVALIRLGIDARVGEVPGEYCPGRYSVNARGERKLMGVGQRLTSRAAHTGGVVVVDGAERVRHVLLPVCRALRLDWDPATVGSVADEVGGVAFETVVAAIVEEFSSRHETVPGELGPETLAAAEGMVEEHSGPPDQE